MAIAVGAVGGVADGIRQASEAQAQERHDSAKATFDAAATALYDAHEAGRRVVDASEGHLLAEDVVLRDQLAALVPGEAVSVGISVQQLVDRDDATSAYLYRTPELEDQTRTIVTATRAVEDAMERWELSTAKSNVEAARGELNAAVTAAEEILARWLPDDALRASLVKAIESARAASTRPEPTTPAELDAMAQDLSAERELLVAAGQAVTDAQAEQDRIAAETAAAQPSTPGTKSGSGTSSSGSGNSGSGKSGGSSGGSTGGSGSPSTGGGSNDSGGGGSDSGSGGGNGGWVEGWENGGDVTWCMDTSGNAWPC